MGTKAYVTISLITSIISLIYTILSYYGITRYLKILLSSPKKYIKKYGKLDIGDKDRVIISMSTSSSKIRPVINSLLDQTVKVDLIAINVPYGKKYKLPKDLEDAVALYRTSKPYGSSTCLIPAVMREGEKTTKIITVGDNVIYGKDFIEVLLKESKKHPNDIV